MKKDKTIEIDKLQPKKIIEVKNLTKTFSSFDAVKSINFDVYEGEIFGFLGQNGAGKSTVINMITTMLPITGGEIKLDGHNVEIEPKAIREKIGIVFQQQTLDQGLSIEMNLKMHAKLFNVPNSKINERINYVLKLVALQDKRKAKVGSLSGGQKRRVELGRSLIHRPKILFLDEPTTGLDPQTRKDIWEYILKLQKEENMTIFLTTHYMDEADICKRIAIIDEGEIIELDTPTKLKEKLTTNKILFNTNNLVVAKKETKQINKNIKVITSKNNGLVTIELGRELSVTEYVVKLLKKKNFEIKDLRIERPSMDEVFLSAVNDSTKLKRHEIAEKDQKKLTDKKNKIIELRDKIKSINASKEGLEKVPNLKDELVQVKLEYKIESKKQKSETKSKNKIKIAEVKEIEKARKISNKKLKIEIDRKNKEQRADKSVVKPSKDQSAKGRITVHTVYKREIIKFFTNITELIMQITFPIMILLLFGLLGSSPSEGIEFIDSVAVILPGTIGIIAATTGLFYGINVIMDINEGFMREMLVSPMRRTELALGKIFGGTTIIVLQGLFLFLIGFAFSGSEYHQYEFKDIFITIAGLIAIGLALLSISVLLSVKITNVKSFQSSMSLLSFPMMFFNGVFIPVEVFGNALSWLVLLNPVTYGAWIFTSALSPETAAEVPLEIYGWEVGVGASWAILLIIIVVFTTLAIRAITKLNGSKEFKGSLMPM